MKLTSPRHRWGLPSRTETRTERVCLRGCGVAKVTRHDGDGFPWVEYETNGGVVRAAPKCEGKPS